MPHSVFTGRPTPAPGEPLFTEEDTAAAVALAEEEQATCPSCGFLKVWCRDPAHQFSFEPVEEICFPSWRLAQFRESDGWKGKHEATKAATQMSGRFRDGHEPDLEAGLDLGDGEDVADYEGQERHRSEGPGQPDDRPSNAL